MANKQQAVKVVNDHAPMGWVLFMAWVGATAYFYNLDPGFIRPFIAMLKAAVWPAYVLYYVLGLLGVY